MKCLDKEQYFELKKRFTAAGNVFLGIALFGHNGQLNKGLLD